MKIIAEQSTKISDDLPIILFPMTSGKLSTRDSEMVGKVYKKKIEDFLKAEGFDSKKSEVFRLFDEKFKAIFLLSSGEEKQTSLLSMGAKLGKKLRDDSQKTFRLFFPEKLSASNCQMFLEGLFAGDYRFEAYKTEKKNKGKNKDTEIRVVDPPLKFSEILKTAQAIADGVNLTRDCCNKPGNDFAPRHFKAEMEKIAKTSKLSLEVIDEAKAKKLGMNCFYSVTKGSDEPGYILILQYKPAKKAKKHLMMVGKGLTFDSGGISIKPAASMEEMKFDMCGGGAVLGAIKAIAELKPNVNVTAVIATSENLINGKASKPGDIYKSYEGLNVEIVNTDAEGRLILADALAYGVQNYKPDAVIDLATLTGACIVALGKHYAGLFSNNDRFCERVETAAKNTGESVWRLPLDERFSKQIESTYADIKNTGGRYGGAITAATFLEKFVGQTPWVHLDIAGTSWDNKAVDYYPSSGSSGFGTRLLIELATNRELEL